MLISETIKGAVRIEKNICLLTVLLSNIIRPITVSLDDTSIASLLKTNCFVLHGAGRPLMGAAMLTSHDNREFLYNTFSQSSGCFIMHKHTSTKLCNSPN